MKSSSIKRMKTKTSKELSIFKTVNNNYLIANSIKINAPYFLSEYLIPIWFEKESYINSILLVNGE